jgi:hypothetical protein
MQKTKKEDKMTASLKLIAISVSVTLMVVAGMAVAPMVKVVSDEMSSTPAYFVNTVDALKQRLQNGVVSEFTPTPQIVDQKTIQRNAVERKLKTKGYNEKFLNLLNDHSILMLARKEGLTVKDWRM